MEGCLLGVRILRERDEAFRASRAERRASDFDCMVARGRGVEPG